jgi:hypothetical protein
MRNDNIINNYFDEFPSSTRQVNNNLNKFKKLLDINDQIIGVIDNWSTNNDDRFVEDVKLDTENVICTTYFTSNIDPQRKIKVENDNIKYIEPWYYSILNLNLYGLVFYDNLSDDFINTYQTDKIKFVKCKLGNYSLNDERFIVYYMYFLKHRYKNIFLTDGNDVTVNINPFTLIDNKKINTIFVGRGYNNKIKHSNWNITKVRALQKDINHNMPEEYYEMAVYNAGIIGGSFHTTMYFLRQMNRQFFIANTSNNHNMSIMHYVLFYYFYPNCRKGLRGIFAKNTRLDQKMRLTKYFKSKNLLFLVQEDVCYENDTSAISSNIFSGFPLCSKFYQFETNSKACFTHK